MTRPSCYNRPPLLPGRWIRDGERRFGKPHYRWSAHRMSTECMSQDQVEYMGGDCRGCRWAK